MLKDARLLRVATANEHARVDPYLAQPTMQSKRRKRCATECIIGAEMKNPHVGLQPATNSGLRDQRSIAAVR